MKHLTEEELVEHYYGEDFYKADAEMHLQTCSQCAQAYEELGKLLGSVRISEPPARNPEYGAQIWQSIQGSLQAYPVKKRRGFLVWPQLAYAAACLLFVAGAFVAGRLWEQTHRKTLLADTPQQSRERIVLFVLNNHLDRSERLLVQLNHAGAEVENANFLRLQAQQLLTDNQLYRQSAAQADDPLLTVALDHLERVLLEVANSPDELSSADVARIEQEMNTQSLLFQIRVLRTKVSKQEQHTQAIPRGVIL